MNIIYSKKKKKTIPPYKNRKNKTVWEKLFRGKFRRWGKLKRHKPNQKKVEDTHEEKYSLFQYMQT